MRAANRIELFAKPARELELAPVSAPELHHRRDPVAFHEGVQYVGLEARQVPERTAARVSPLAIAPFPLVLRPRERDAPDEARALDGSPADEREAPHDVPDAHGGEE